VKTSCRKSSEASNSKTASRSSKCRLTTPPDRTSSPNLPHSSCDVVPGFNLSGAAYNPVKFLNFGPSVMLGDAFAHSSSHCGSLVDCIEYQHHRSKRAQSEFSYPINCMVSPLCRRPTLNTKARGAPDAAQLDARMVPPFLRAQPDHHPCKRVEVLATNGHGYCFSS
jgi:hypothetical protein